MDLDKGGLKMEPTRRRKGRKIEGGFFAVPRAVMHSPVFRELPAIAVKLLLDIGSQYNGRNNGDLSIAWKLMRMRGWRSEETLHRAKTQLLNGGLISETRKGRRPNVCSLYGITWLALDPSTKYDIQPWAFPFGAWNAARPETKVDSAGSLTTVIEEAAKT